MNRKAAVLGTALVIGLFLMIGTFQDSSKVTGVLALKSPLSVTPVPRQGVAAAAFPTSQSYLPQLGSWAAIWWPYDGVYPTTFQLVPMLVWRNVLPTTSTVQTIAAEKGHEYWLVFNECENVGQCNRLPADQAQFYHNQILPLAAAGDPNAKLIIGGTIAHECGLSWLTQFVQAYRFLYHPDPPRAGWHFHIYPDVVPYDPQTGHVWQPGEPCPVPLGGTSAGQAPSITNYIAQANAFRRWWSLYGSPTDEIWVTETGCLDPTYCPNNSTTTYIAAITAYLNNDGRWIDRYAWYTDNDGPTSSYYKSWLMTYPVTGQLTGIGTYYSQVVPASHVPGFQYLVFLPVVLNNGSGGASPAGQLSPFVSPLPVPSSSTFQSPLPMPGP